MNKPRNIIKKFFLWTSYGVLCVVVVLILFEIIYRTQLIDTYRPELRGYNDPAVLENAEGKPTLLIMGDSFTAGRYSYAERLRPLMPQRCIVNAGVSGTGIVQANVMASRRFAAFQPSIFIYQIYVGNDLINVRYPINWKTLSSVRNVYGLLVDRFPSVYYLNYRLGQRWYEKARSPLPLESTRRNVRRAVFGGAVFAHPEALSPSRPLDSRKPDPAARGSCERF